MPDSPSLEEIIKSNPHVDPEQLEQWRELLKKLREAGVRGSRDRIVPPGARRRVVAGEESGNDPRTVHLRHRR
jgi:Na+-translocating ferredoxin:NAD+ oxidoreductase RnfC subunit